MPILLQYTLQISPIIGLILVYTHIFQDKYSILSLIFGKAPKSLSNQSQSCPKIETYLKKHVKYCLQVLERTSIILSSSKMYSKAGSKYYVYSLLAVFLWLFLLMNITNLNL